MSNLITKLSATAVALVLALPLQAQNSPDADTVMATVNGTEITLGHMLMVRASLPEEYQQIPNDVLWDGILDQLVQQTALAQTDEAVETKRVRVALENERRALLASEVIAATVEDAVSDEAVQEAYEAAYGAVDQGMEYNASHILVETEEEAQALIAQLNDGADFATLARDNSTGPSGPNGGELGWFGAGMMVEPFQEAVEVMEVGAVSDPVQTQFGWHVIRLNETRSAAAPSLDEVRDELIATVQKAAVDARIAELIEDAEVTRTTKEEVDTSVLQQLDLLGD